MFRHDGVVVGDYAEWLLNFCSVYEKCLCHVVSLICVVISGQHLVSAARQRAAEKQEVTPSRIHALVPTHLQDNLEKDPTHLMLKEMCIRVIGKGVASLQQLRDQMFLEMTSGDSSEAYRYMSLQAVTE